jgi:hypothetical protein
MMAGGGYADPPRPSQLHATSILDTLLYCDMANVGFAHDIDKLAGLPI